MKPLPAIVAGMLALTAVGLVISGSMPSSAPPDNGSAEAVSPKPSPRLSRQEWQTASGTASARPPEAPAPAAGPETSGPAESASSSPGTTGKPALSASQRRAAEFRRQLRHEGERFDEAIGAHVVLQPAAWVDLGEDASLPPGHHDGIQQIAAELREKIASSGLDPATPEYRRLWNQAVRESNWKFRARFGARAWTRHHIQAHHMALGQNTRN